MSKARAAANRGLAYIVRSQQPDGGFAIASDTSPAPYSLTVDLLLHALLLDTLRNLDDPTTQTVTQRLARYLLRKLPRPDQPAAYGRIDTHALCQALASLYEYDPELVSPAAVAATVNHLVANEVEPGGPYRNALDSPTSPPDLTTNYSVSRFIHHIGGPFPKLNDYIANSRIADPHARYYNTEWALAAHAALPPIAHPETPASPGVSLTIPVHDLLTSQQPDGAWTIEFFCKDPHQTTTVCYGAAALTTALAVHKLLQHHGASHATSMTSRDGDDMYRALRKAAQDSARACSPLLAPTIRSMLERIIQADSNREIGPLAIRFARALTVKQIPPIITLRKLGLANLYNWVAYTIYDDFLDDEGQPRLLSAANVALRKSIALFTEAVPDDDFRQLVAGTFDTMDAANAWEIANCRFPVHGKTVEIGVLPDYADLHSLYERSLSHTLPVIGCLIASGLSMADKAVTDIKGALKSYLIIRQLSDDLHDWQKDLRAGHISYVVAQALSDAGITIGPKDLTQLVPHMELSFQQHTLPIISTLISAHAKIARRLIRGSGVVAADNVIEQLLRGIEQAIEQIFAEQEQAALFLHAYSTSK